MAHIRMPLASLAQTTDNNRIPPSYPEHFKHYPLAQVLYFHEQRLKILESAGKETDDSNTGKDTLTEILNQKVIHLENVCQQLNKTLSELKEQQNNVTLEVEEE